MAILRPDTTTTFGGVTVNEYLLTKHNPNGIDMPAVSMVGKSHRCNYSQYRLDHSCKRNDPCGTVHESNRQ